MIALDDKLEELKERRGEALSGIISSQQNINDMIGNDTNIDNYLFGGNGNPVGILKLLQLYQQERTCEKDITYRLSNISDKATIENQISTDISNIMSSSAEPPRYSPNYFYYIDADSNMKVNDGSFPDKVIKTDIRGVFTSATTFRAKKSFSGIYVGDEVEFEYDYISEIYHQHIEGTKTDKIKNINGKIITLETAFSAWEEASVDELTDVKRYKSKSAILFNNGETNPIPTNNWSKCVENELGDKFTDNHTTIDPIPSGTTAFDALENSDRGSGFLKYWDSYNKINYSTGEDPSPQSIGGNNKIWVWYATNESSYQTAKHISSLLYNLNGLINSLTRLPNILRSIKTARIAISEQGQDFWESMDIEHDNIVDDSYNLEAKITNINNWKNELSGYYNDLYDERETNTSWIEPNGTSHDTALRDKINGAIDGLNRFSWSSINNFLNDRFTTTNKFITNSNTTGLYQWVNLWLTEKISLENGSYTSLYFLTQSINEEMGELYKAENDLKKFISGNEIVPTLNVFAAYSDPKFDKVTGETVQNRLGVVFDGQLYGQKYTIYRKRVRAFDYYNDSSVGFKWDNSNWGNVGTQAGDAIYEIIGWQGGSLVPAGIDPESGLTKTEFLSDVNDDELYIFRVMETDGKTIFLTNRQSSYNGNTYSKQSKMFDDNGKKFMSISNGVIYCKNHGFKRGNVVLIKSDVTDPNIYKKNPISGFYRVVDADENTFVLEGLPNTNYGGIIYKTFGVASIKPLPYVSYDSDGKPLLS